MTDHRSEALKLLDDAYERDEAFEALLEALAHAVLAVEDRLTQIQTDSHKEPAS